jgi:hypothetical protein
MSSFILHRRPFLTRLRLNYLSWRGYGLTRRKAFAAAWRIARI